MEEGQKTSTRLTKGRGFPAIALPEAVKIIRKAGGVSRNLTTGSLAQYAGHSTSNSGPFRTKVAALRDWGLIAAPKDGKITLTDRAMIIALPESESAAEQAMREAFFGFELFATMYSDSAKNIELSRVNMANTAVHTLKVAIQAKDKFVKSFITSAVSIGLAETIGKDKVILKVQAESNSDSAATDQEPPVSVEQGPQAVTPPHVAKTTPVMQQAWEFEGGKVHLIIESSSPLSLEVFHELPNVIGSIQTLVEVLGPKDNTNGVSA